ncbi:MAG: hypothetical protein WBV90_01395 [Terrimicrobiaceae bacterium]
MVYEFQNIETPPSHPVGGCSAVTAAMARVAERLGVEICLDRPVDEVLFEGRRAVGVRTAAGLEKAAAIVINADFARAMSRLVPDRLRRRWTDRKIARKKFSCFEDLDRVYLVGGGTHPGSGLPVIFESARISARLLLADLGLATAVDPMPRPPLEPMDLEPA